MVINMRPFLLALCSAILGRVSAQDPWYFTWTDPSNQSHPASGSKPSGCIEINNPKGRYFDWEAGDGWCIYFWEDPNCSEIADAGYTCKTWPWRANATHHNLRAFKVVLNGTDYMSSPSSTTTASSTSMVTNTSAADSPFTDNVTFSKGAMAGMIVGIVAGVGMLSASVWWFFYRRHHQPPNTELSSASPLSDPRGHGTEKPEVEAVYPLSGAIELLPDAKTKPAELMGSDGLVEMSDTHRVVELGTSETMIEQLSEEMRGQPAFK